MNHDFFTNSHYFTYTFRFKRLGECNFLILGVRGLKGGEAELHMATSFISQCWNNFKNFDAVNNARTNSDISNEC